MDFLFGVLLGVLVVRVIVYLEDKKVKQNLARQKRRGRPPKQPTSDEFIEQ